MASTLQKVSLPRPAIRPYPRAICLAIDGPVTVCPWWIRPIRPEDEPLMVKFHGTISDESVYFRFFHAEKLSSRVAHERLFPKCFIDYDREMALVADFHSLQTDQH